MEGVAKEIVDSLGGLNKTRPPGSPLVVNLAFALFQLYELNQEYNTVTSSVSLVVRWRDAGLVWDPAAFDNTSLIRVPPQLLWIPDVYAYYGIDKTPGGNKDQLRVRISHDGWHYIELPFLVRTFCGIDVERFPFDRQHCEMHFDSWSYNDDELRWKAIPEVDLDNYFANQEWRLLNVSVEETRLSTKAAGNYSIAKVGLWLGREPFYYIFNLVIPATVVTLTSVFGMHAPTPPAQRRQPRSQLGVVTLLPMGVMLLTIVNDLPKFALVKVEGPRGSFSGVPLLGMYYLALLVTISLCTTSYNGLVWLDRAAAEGRDLPGPLRCLAPSDGKGARTQLRSRCACGGGVAKGAAAWETLIRRLEVLSLIFYVALVGVWLLLFFYHDWR